MTTRLYYTDAMRATFDATVLGCEPIDGGAHVTLDATAFYPTSGGQPHDTGILGGRRVLDVIDRGDGTIVHVLDDALAVGAAVEGALDWPRRFDHMQQHTGQHILSAAFDRTCGVRTESFHLGTTSGTIDLACEVTAAQIAAAETAACAVVWDDRPVTVRFASEADVAALPLRKESARTGTVRLVEVDDFDLSACGGTHVPRTGMIGIVAVAGWERFKGGSRIEFVCGGRALASHGRLRDQVTTLVRQLTVAPHELSGAVDRLQTEGRARTKLVRQLQAQVARQLAGALVAGAEDVGAFRRVLVTQDGWDVAALKALAASIVDRPGLVAVVIGTDTPVPLVVACAADVAFDARVWLTQAATTLGGRGGGRPELAQGGLAATPDRILAFARDTVR